MDGAVRVQRPRHPGLVRAAPGRTLACGDQRAQHGARGGVLDDAAARRAALERLGQPQRVDQPVEHAHLQLGARGARGPVHALHAGQHADGQPLAFQNGALLDMDLEGGPDGKVCAGFAASVADPLELGPECSPGSVFAAIR